MSAADRPDADGRRRIQSINVGFALVRALVDAQIPLSLKELADATGMPSSQAHLYMASFLKEALVVQDPGTNRYDLGPYALDLGLAAMHRVDAIECAKPQLLELQRRTGEAVFVAVWGNRGPCIVLKLDGARRSAMQLRVGYVLSLMETATGHVFLASMPEEETAEVLRFERAATGANISRKQIGDIIKRTRATGLGISDNLRNDGFTSLSAPIVDHSNVIRAAMTVTGPSGDFDGREKSPIAAALRDASAAVSRALGHTSVA